MDFSGHVFTVLFDALNSALAGIVGKYAAVIGIVSPALRIGMVIYISLLGYAIMRGAVQYPFREYAYRGCQLAFLYFAVTSLYGAQIGIFALGGLPGQFATALGGADAGGLGGFYDKLAGSGFLAAHQLQEVADTYQKSQGLVPDIGYAFFTGFLIICVIIATIVCAAIGFTITAFGLFALALLSVVGPLFVAALLFESTRGYFFAWLGACLNYLMLIVFCLVLTLFLTQTGEALLATIGGDAAGQAGATGDILVGATKAIAFYILGFFFFLQIPSLAASLGGGGPALANQFAQAVAAAGGFVIGQSFGGAKTPINAIARGVQRGIARARTSGAISNASSGGTANA
jgi:type IV secretion system protein VirB6